MEPERSRSNTRRPQPRPHGTTFEGIAIRVAQRVLAPAAAIWRSNQIDAPVTRSLIEFDH
ncbi:hypothetical protein OG500_11440 [Kitasatospora sp. NBC_01250]|nr:hypothetical protein [Kitasatospora sp. NBC_01250]